jgi:ubiquitin C-terminal hydrolase
MSFEIVGLPNVSNTCYINSVLQALYNTSYFREFLTSYDHDLNFQNLFDIQDNKDKRRDYIRYLVRLTKYFPGYFIINQQNDAQEFFIIMIDTFYENVKTKISNQLLNGIINELTHDTFEFECRKRWLTNYSPIQEVLYSQIGREIQCSVCANVVTNIENTCIFYIDPVYDVESAIRRHFQPLFQNDWRCDKCGNLSNHNRTTCYITKIPKVIVLCIKRFGIDGKSKTKQNNDIPKRIDVKKYLKIPQPRTQYTLSSVVEHVGSLNYGHYYTTVITDSKIITIDDETIKISHEASINDKNSYMIVYEQVKDTHSTW